MCSICARILPTRNGNWFASLLANPLDYARILPTRNGNRPKGQDPIKISRRTDPTYKEWKRGLEASRFVKVIGARILPTRNGNSDVLIVPVTLTFRTDPTYKEWKLLHCDGDGDRAEGARILPTRNGNLILGFRSPSGFAACTDPTYKEWKPRLAMRCLVMSMLHGSYLQGMETRKPIRHRRPNRCTDPTYKEWKLPPFLILHTTIGGTDPTYKEWKPAKYISNTNSAMARILPTRNGNKGGALRRPFCLGFARILPTRNGNKLRAQTLLPTNSARILPTRNGNKRG